MPQTPAAPAPDNFIRYLEKKNWLRFVRVLIRYKKVSKQGSGARAVISLFGSGSGSQVNFGSSATRFLEELSEELEAFSWNLGGPFQRYKKHFVFHANLFPFTVILSNF